MLEMKVLFHINEPEKWPELLGNVRNLLTGISEATELEVIIVANGRGVQGYVSEEVLSGIEDLPTDVVTFKACQNALNGQGIAKEDLVDRIQVVPAGVIEIINQQALGFSYIKP